MNCMTGDINNKYFKAVQCVGFIKLLMVAIFFAPDFILADNKIIPSRPFVENVENCKAYKEAAYQALHDQFQKESSCITATRANISRGTECNDLTGQVQEGVLAWPHCEDAEYHCALVRASEDASGCMRQAKAQENYERPKADSVLTDMVKADALVSEIRDDYRMVRNPEEYLKGRVVDKLAEANKNAFMNSVFDSSGKLSPYGVKVTDQFYEWGFKNLTLNAELMSYNPIIQAIQRESFTALGNMQQQMLGELQGLRDSIKGMETHNFEASSVIRIFTQDSAAREQAGSKAPAPSLPECAVLADGVAASNLSIDHPARFEALIKACGG